MPRVEHKTCTYVRNTGHAINISVLSRQQLLCTSFQLLNQLRAHVRANHHLLALKHRHTGSKYYFYCCLSVLNRILLLPKPAIVYVVIPINKKCVYKNSTYSYLLRITARRFSFDCCHYQIATLKRHFFRPSLRGL